MNEASSDKLTAIEADIRRAAQALMRQQREDGHWVFEGDTSDVSGQIKSIPDLPTIVVAQDTKLLAIGATPSRPESKPADRERWTAYGIGRLLQ